MKIILKFLRFLFWDDSPAALAEAARRRERKRIRDLASHSCSRCSF